MAFNKHCLQVAKNEFCCVKFRGINKYEDKIRPFFSQPTRYNLCRVIFNTKTGIVQYKVVVLIEHISIQGCLAVSCFSKKSQRSHRHLLLISHNRSHLGYSEASVSSLPLSVLSRFRQRILPFLHEHKLGLSYSSFIVRLQVTYGNSWHVVKKRSGNKQWFKVLSTVFEHDRIVSSTQKNFRARDAVECSNVFLSAGNNPGVLKNSTEHAEPLFITFRQFP